ncbi:MAG: hypothetical protein OIN83_07115 [Candidatus Methanoperedens sp.]|nr:hypothetical protein [Candidatus Methanoperedens sp.]
MKLEKILLMDDKGISEIIGIILILGIIVIFLGILQSKSVPEWNKEIEAGHFNTIFDDVLDLRQALQETAIYVSPRTTVVHAALDYPTRMFLQNSLKPGATISTMNNNQIRISYNGTTTEVVNSCTIRIKENYNYFSAPELIIEHGMIIGKVGHTNYTIDDPLMNNKTIDLYLVECENSSIGTTSSMNIHLFPVMVSNQSATNASITFTTDYPELWDTYLESINVDGDPPFENEITMNYNNATRIRTFITRIIV